MRNERRRHVRFRAQENAYAALGRKYSRVGKIRDISIGGLALEYIAGEGSPLETSQIDIFLTENNFQIYNLSCKVVYDVVVYVPRVKSQFSDLLLTRRCGIRFGALSVSNRRRLRVFIEGQAEGD